MWQQTLHRVMSLLECSETHERYHWSMATLRQSQGSSQSTPELCNSLGCEHEKLLRHTLATAEWGTQCASPLSL